MRILFLGDIVGQPGREAVKQHLPHLKRKYQPHVVIANGENSANGKGITQRIAHELFEAGIHILTMGNHTWDNKDIFQWIEDEPRVIRPANYPDGTPGTGMAMVKLPEGEVAVINLQGRSFLPPLECPFATADRLVEQASKRTRMIFVDFHAEATSEKQALAWYLDGRISALIGTHTHVQTGDERILPGGTAYLTDAGMCGPLDGVLGIDREAVIRKFRTQLPVRFEVAGGRTQVNGVFLVLDRERGRATKIERIRIDEEHILME